MLGRMDLHIDTNVSEKDTVPIFRVGKSQAVSVHITVQCSEVAIKKEGFVKYIFILFLIAWFIMLLSPF